TLAGAVRRVRRRGVRAEAGAAAAPPDHHRWCRAARAPARGTRGQRLVRLRAHGGAHAIGDRGAAPATQRDGPRRRAVRDLAHHLRADDRGAGRRGRGGRHPSPDRVPPGRGRRPRGHGARAGRALLPRVTPLLRAALWAHPVLGLVTVAVAVRQASLGLRGRAPGVAPAALRARHRRLGPWLLGLVVTNWLLGLASVWIDPRDLEVAASGH